MARLSRDAFPGLIPIGGGESDLYLQVGKAAFDGVYTDTTDVPVRSQLTHVDFAIAAVYDTYSPATDATMTEYGLFVDPVPATGAISVYRSSQGAVSGLPFNYCFIGRVEASD